jgi:hypothetical protein
MTAVDVRRPAGLPLASAGRAVLWFVVFLGGFVFYEPAPYELFLALILPFWLIANPRLPRTIAPLLILMIAFMTGGLLAALQAKSIGDQPIYYAVTGFLALSSCFYAAVLGANPRLFDTVVNAWIVAALATVALGVLGYFGLTGELFTKFGRAAGGFQDPNVFGPFLIFPFVLLVRRALTGSLLGALVSGVVALAIFAGIFLSFSRGAWGAAVLATMLMVALLFATERNALVRARYVALVAGGLVAVVALLVVALSIPAIGDLFQERAQIVQDYDGGHLGRFDRHIIGFNLMLEHPLGIGAHTFGYTFGEDEHDIWLKTLTTYGWLGFAAFLTLVVWTLVAAFPLLFRTGPLQGVTQVAYVVFVGHILLATVIDIDHWRHFFLLFGMLWGAVAAERNAVQAKRAELHLGNGQRVAAAATIARPAAAL